MKTLQVPVLATQLTVTATAQTLEEMMRTALSDATYKINPQLDALDIYVEGTIRLLYDGNTPTSTLGIKIITNGYFNFRNLPLHKFKLIREGGSDVIVNVQVGITQTP